LIDVCEQNSLRMLNRYFKHNRIHNYTWHHDTKELRSIKDYTFARHNSGLKHQDIRVFRGKCVGIDR
jgi:hypothetical protein